MPESQPKASQWPFQPLNSAMRPQFIGIIATLCISPIACLILTGVAVFLIFLLSQIYFGEGRIKELQCNKAQNKDSIQLIKQNWESIRILSEIEMKCL
jgi:hypothetical protein